MDAAPAPADAAGAGVAPTAEIAAVEAPVTVPVAESAPVETLAREPVPVEMSAAAVPEVLIESKSEEATSSAEHLAGRNLEAVDLQAAASAPAEPEMIEVWRPAGRFEKRPHKPRRPRRPERTKAATPAVASDAAPDGVVLATPEVAAVAPEKSAEPAQADRAKDGIRDRERRDRLFRQERRERKEKAERRDQRVDATSRPSGGGRGRRDKGDRVERAEREQYYAKPHGSGSDRRDKQPDPNSPFAKLAALKQQLEQSTKES